LSKKLFFSTLAFSDRGRRMGTETNQRQPRGRRRRKAMKLAGGAVLVLLLATGAGAARAQSWTQEVPAVVSASPQVQPGAYHVESVPPPRAVLPPPPVVPGGGGYAPVIQYKPLVPLAPMPPQYYIGRGLFGQPKLYVPEQPMRNFLRYLSL
jgi:hypothetical protein